MVYPLTLFVVCSVLAGFGRCSLGPRNDHDQGAASFSHVITFPSSSSDDVGDLCGELLECVPLSGCETASLEPRQVDLKVKKTFPKICGWEITEPRICCIRSAAAAAANESEPIGSVGGATVADEPNTKTKLSNVNANANMNDCAVNASRRQDGPSASTMDWPFMVAIFIVLGGEKIFLCGGTLVSRTSILTAAHCFENRIDTDVYVVHVGTSELIGSDSNPSLASKPATVQELVVADVIVHEGFVRHALHNDVAILKFTGPPLNYSDTVRPVCLPAADDVLPDGSKTPVNVIRWGSQEFGSAASQVQEKVVLRLVSNAKCNETYSAMAAAKTALPNGITKSHLCAGDVDGSKNACQGDPGGPLVVTDSSLRWVQIGIVSSGIDCDTVGVPGVYSRVSQYADWIRSKG